jgi:hypothetical protein
MKKFILMLIACLVLSSSIVYGAPVIRSAYFNEGLTLAVNNSQADVRFVTVELEGEQYGRNYVSVADFVKALNDYAGLNATVDFDSKTQTIVVDSKVIESNVEGITKTGGDIVSEQPEVPLNKYGLPDFSNYEGVLPEIEVIDGNSFFTYDGVKYIWINATMGQRVTPDPYFIQCPIIDGKVSYMLQLAKKTQLEETILIDEIPHARYRGKRDFCLSYDYYLNTILPLTQGAE